MYSFMYSEQITWETVVFKYIFTQQDILLSLIDLQRKLLG